MVFCFLYQIFLGLLLPALPSTFVTQVYCIATGVFLQCYMFGWGIIHVFIMMGVTYFIMMAFPRSQQQKYAFVFNLGYLSYSHIDRMLTSK